MSPRLIAQMIAKDEVSRFLEPVLQRLSTFTDMIVFTDDGSTDDTANIAEKYCKSVRRREDTLFTKNEGALRSEAWAHLTEYAETNDWILAIDADEMLYGLEHLSGLLDQSRYDVIGITFVHMWNTTHFRVDKLWKPTIGSRLFRYRLGGEFKDSLLACGSEPKYVQEMIRQSKMLWNSPLIMKHLGYQRDADKIAKYERYMNLDKGNFHNLEHIESIIDQQFELMEWKLDD